MLRVFICAVALIFSSPVYATGKHKKPKDKDQPTQTVDVATDIVIKDHDVNVNHNQNELRNHSENNNRNQNANHNRNANDNRNQNANNNRNNNDNDNRNNNRNSNDNRNNNDNRNDNRNNNANNNRNDVRSNNRNANNQGQDQAQGQDQRQGQAQGQSQNARSDANSNSAASADNANNNNINIDGDETFVTYEQAAAQAAIVFANSSCATEGASAGNVEKVFSSARESAYCRNLTMAMAYLDAMMANEYVFVTHNEKQATRIKTDIINWETQIRSAQDSFQRELIKGGSKKSEAQIIAEQRMLSFERQVKADLLPERYEQFREVMEIRLELQDHYVASLDGFYSSINSAEVSIKRRGLTGFFVESLTDVISPIALIAILFR